MSSPNSNHQIRKRTKKVTEKRIADDEFMAAAIGDVEWLRQSLRGTRGGITFDKNGLAPIHLSAIHGRLECLKLLIEKFRVDVNIPSTTGWRPVHLCISNQTGKRSLTSLSYLLQQGADPSICNEDGITPCHQAASEGHVACLKLLLEAGGSVMKVDRRGHTPMDLAKLWGHRKCARLLAAEEWQQNKDFITGEMHQLKRVKMYEVLREIEQEQAEKLERQKTDERAFTEWLYQRSISRPPAPPSASWSRARSAKTQIQEQQPSISKQETKSKISKPTVQVVTKDDAARANTATTRFTPVPPTSELSKRDKSPNNAAPPNKLQHIDWNKSTKVAGKDYVPNLCDFYPRDPYTMLPKYKLYKDGSRSPTMILDEYFDNGEKITHKLPLAMPNVPSKVLEEELSLRTKKVRPVVYNSKNIIDTQRKKVYDDAHQPARSEIGMHLGNDLQSPFFKRALLTVQQEHSALSHASNSSVGSTKASTTAA